MDYKDFQACDNAWSTFIRSVDNALATSSGTPNAGELASNFTALKAAVFPVIQKLAQENRKPHGSAILTAVQTVAGKLAEAQEMLASQASFKPRQTRPGMISGPDAATMFLQSSNVRDRLESLKATSLAEQANFQRICLGLG